MTSSSSAPGLGEDRLGARSESAARLRVGSPTLTVGAPLIATAGPDHQSTVSREARSSVKARCPAALLDEQPVVADDDHRIARAPASAPSSMRSEPPDDRAELAARSRAPAPRSPDPMLTAPVRLAARDGARAPRATSSTCRKSRSCSPRRRAGRPAFEQRRASPPARGGAGPRPGRRGRRAAPRRSVVAEPAQTRRSSSSAGRSLRARTASRARAGSSRRAAPSLGAYSKHVPRPTSRPQPCCDERAWRGRSASATCDVVLGRRAGTRRASRTTRSGCRARARHGRRASATAAGSVRSQRSRRIAGDVVEPRAPGSPRRRACTSSPARASARATREPTNPAAPVTSTASTRQCCLTAQSYGMWLSKGSSRSLRDGSCGVRAAFATIA